MNSELTVPNKAREAVPDILKCLCCVFVIVIHTASRSMSALPINSFNWYSAAFWGCLCRPAVPVFLMVSGALLLDVNKALSIRRIYSRYFLRMLLCLLFWAFVYELYFIAGYWILYRQFDPMSFWNAVKSTLSFDHHFHLYYLQLLLLFYVCLPVLRSFVAHAERHLLRYALVVWFVLGILLPTLVKFPPFSSITGIPADYSLRITYSSLGYALLGWYLKSADIQRKDLRRYVLLFLGGFAIVFGMTTLLSLRQGSLNQDFLDGFSPGVMLMAIGLYGSVSALFGNRDAASMPKVAWLSRASFCIYLVHHFFVMLLLTYLYFAYQYFCLVVIPLQVAVELGMSLVAYLVLKRIPWVKDHLI